MEDGNLESEEHSQYIVDSNPSNTINSNDNKKGRKRKKEIKVEKLGESSEYDDSLLKRRK